MPTTPRKSYNAKATPTTTANDLSTLEARYQAFQTDADPKRFNESYGTYIALRNDVAHASQAHETKHAKYVQQLDHVPPSSSCTGTAADGDVSHAEMPALLARYNDLHAQMQRLQEGDAAKTNEATLATLMQLWTEANSVYAQLQRVLAQPLNVVHV